MQKNQKYHKKSNKIQRLKQKKIIKQLKLIKVGTSGIHFFVKFKVDFKFQKQFTKIKLLVLFNNLVIYVLVKLSK